MEYCSKIFEQISDQDFAQKFPQVIHKLYIDTTTDEKIIESIQITDEQLKSIKNMFIDACSSILQAANGITSIKEQLQSANISDSKILTITKTLNDNLDVMRHKNVYANIKDVWTNTFVIKESITELQRQNKLILSAQEEILRLLKGS